MLINELKIALKLVCGVFLYSIKLQRVFEPNLGNLNTLYAFLIIQLKDHISKF